MKATTSVSDLSLYKRKLRWQAEPGVNGRAAARPAATAKTHARGAVGTVALDPDGAVIATSSILPPKR